MNTLNSSQKKNYGAWSFIPLIAFLITYLGSGVFFAAMGYAGDSFKQIPRMFALVVALLCCVAMGGKERSLEYRMDKFCEGMANQGTMIMLMVFLLAGAFSGVAKAMGGVDATANLGLSLIPSKFILGGIFLISAFVATAMGTGMGTISAIGPIAIAIAEGSGVSMSVAIATVVGGAMFGDNLSMISDTTIAATRGAGCEMRDKFKMNGLIAAVAAIITIVILSVTSSPAEITGVYEYDLIKVVPYVFILIIALTGCNVFTLLLSGTALAAVIGLATGSFTFIDMAKACASGMAGMFELCMIALLLRGICNVVDDLGGIGWMVNKMTNSVKSRRGAEYTISGMVSIFDAALCNNTVSILLAAPLCRKLAADHNIAPKRVASLLDIFSCVVQGIIPHGGQILLAVSLTGLSPFAIIGGNYYVFILGIVALITIQFGLGRTKEEREGIPMYDENLEVIDLKK